MSSRRIQIRVHLLFPEQETAMDAVQEGIRTSAAVEVRVETTSVAGRVESRRNKKESWAVL